ncbi:hypothetical protein JH06_3878 [Blastocystis sp. subtype 4]|uniref:hypothetical protein n=1 Tax=Blastocystis sp. subtype 4 TaxID=944170 RepID=UPI000711F4F5|nr:hypothetical protein JH06_3878 [Blastocystis sp. subtype 4]KNB42799.1 hypothetical protein JH06_3878 [Blastocystis sp. subtype 4]|eukprot:XP_014526242.1 hypothetical protein JH06_3878 [Blastocystis sp. subtype 4]
MNVYRWEDEAKNDDDELYDDETRSIPDLILTIQDILRKRGKHNPIDIQEMSRRIHYDIQDNEELVTKLQSTPMISYEDPLLRFQPPIDADNEEELLLSLQEHVDGVKRNVVEVSSPESKEFIPRLIYQGKIIGTNETNSSEVFSLFPRCRSYMVEISGTATVTKGSCKVVMTENVSQEVRQGDALVIKGVTYRVDSNPEIMPLSVTSIRSLNEKIDTGESKRHWGHVVGKEIWLDRSYQGESEVGVHIHRFGVTNDLRTLWFDNHNSVYSDDKALKEAIKEAGLSYSSVLVTQTRQVKRTRKHTK